MFALFARAHPRRTIMMVCLLILAGLAEGIGLAALLPVLEVAVGDSAEQLTASLKLVVEEIADGFERIRKSL